MNLAFNVAQLLQDKVGESRSYELEAAAGEVPNFPLLGPLTGTTKFIRVPRGIIAQGKLSTSVTTPCARCLGEVREDLSVRFEEEFFATVDVRTAKPTSVDLQAGASTIGPEHVVDLSDVVRQEIQVGMAMHPICRPDCKGICSDCGSDLNESSCGCGRIQRDSAFAILKDLKLH